MRAWRVVAPFAVQAYNPAKNYYKVLNLPQAASPADIKKAFRDLAKKYHPDTNKGKEELFKEVNEAYQVLSDPALKQEYDQVRAANGRSHSPDPARTYNSPQDAPKRQNQQYRGYQPEQGWKNMNFRDQFMYDLYRQQQADQSRHFQQSQKDKMEREFRERMQEAARRDGSDNVRKYSEEAKRKQEEVRKRYEQQQRRQKEEEFQRYRKYRDESINDVGDKLKQNLNKMAETVADNVKDALKVGEHLKDMWQAFKRRK